MPVPGQPRKGGAPPEFASIRPDLHEIDVTDGSGRYGHDALVDFEL